jgi:hypothetical protein
MAIADLVSGREAGAATVLAPRRVRLPVHSGGA